MSRRFELDIPETLTDDEARLVIDVLEELLDILYRQLERDDCPSNRLHQDWSVPDWMDESDEPK